MPKSRKRRPKSRRPRPPAPGTEEFRRQMSALRATDDAERRGDAMAALEIMDAHSDTPGFWRPWRVRSLVQLAMFEPFLPRWATSRWILAQALQHLDPRPGGAGGARTRRALDVAIELRGGLADLHPDQGEATCRVIDHDWAFRQLHLYELGGLIHFLDRAASADLVAGADRIREWAGSPMGGYRLLARWPDTVVWQDLADGRQVRTPNIGNGALMVPGECAIGRLVPIEGGVMFEGPPLAVPDDVATRVAHDPADWVEALRAAGGTTAPGVSMAGDLHGLLTDVPPSVWMALAGDCLADAPPAEPTLGHLADGVLALARVALDGPYESESDAIDLWSCLGAALLSPSVTEGLWETARWGDLDVLEELAALLAEPASSWCSELADSLPHVA